MDVLSVLSIDTRLVTVLSGLLAHLCFNRLEPRNPLIWLTLTIGLPLFFSVLSINEGNFTGFIWTILAHNAVLTLSVLHYRISPFHPLAQYPGPWVARISQAYLFRMAKRGKRHIQIPELHGRYGTHVRIGPNVLSIADVDVTKQCLGVQGMPKARHYRFSENFPLNLINSASVTVKNHRQVHNSKRKLWNQAFTGTNIKEYDAAIDERSGQLVRKLGEQIGVVDLGKWLSYFSFDIMGDVVLGGGFEMLRDGGDVNGYWKHVLDATISTNLLNHFEWTGRIAMMLPVAEGFQRTLLFAEERTNIRASRGPVAKDLYHYLTEARNGKDKDTGISKKQIVDELFIAIIGGSDTTSFALSSIFYSLLTRPKVFDKLRLEIDEEFGDEDAIDSTKLAGLSYLNAVINETLRLYSPAPFSIARTPEKGSGGMVVAGKFVPEGTTIYIPSGALHRDSRYFYPNPNDFVPERWVETGGDAILDRDAFLPFSYGPANCVGKQLAYREMRAVVSRIVQKYNLDFEEGYNPKEWLDTLRDSLIMVKGRLPVKLIRRE